MTLAPHELAALAADDKFYSKLNTKTIREHAGRNSKRIADFSGAGKWECWTDIMNAKHGARRVQAYLEATGQA